MMSEPETGMNGNVVRARVVLKLSPNLYSKSKLINHRVSRAVEIAVRVVMDEFNMDPVHHTGDCILILEDRRRDDPKKPGPKPGSKRKGRVPGPQPGALAPSQESEPDKASGTLERQKARAAARVGTGQDATSPPPDHEPLPQSDGETAAPAR